LTLTLNTDIRSNDFGANIDTECSHRHGHWHKLDRDSDIDTDFANSHGHGPDFSNFKLTGTLVWYRFYALTWTMDDGHGHGHGQGHWIWTLNMDQTSVWKRLCLDKDKVSNRLVHGIRSIDDNLFWIKF